jgi:hypothetical protein
LVQRIFNKTFTALILTFAYILLLVHNFVPHHHEADAQTPHPHAAADHPQGAAHHQEHDHSHDGHENPNKSNPDADHLLSNHQHPFADNKIHHLDTPSAIKLSKKQVLPVLVCFLSFHHYLFRIPDTKPDPPAYLFPPSNYPGRALSLRGPPVA